VTFWTRPRIETAVILAEGAAAVLILCAIGKQPSPAKSVPVTRAPAPPAPAAGGTTKRDALEAIAAQYAAEHPETSGKSLEQDADEVRRQREAEQTVFEEQQAAVDAQQDLLASILDAWGSGSSSGISRSAV